MEVADAVACGRADAGPGIMAVARALGLDFLPLQDERDDLVIPLEFLNTPAVQGMLDVAVSSPFQTELEALGGYDSSRTGTIVAELPAPPELCGVCPLCCKALCRWTAQATAPHAPFRCHSTPR